MSEREELVQAVAALNDRPWAAAEQLVGRWLAGHPVHSSWLNVGLGPQIEAARAEAKAAAWEALCVYAAGLIARGPNARTDWTTGETRLMHGVCKPGRSASVVFREISGVALFARLMAIVSRPS